MDFFSWWRGAWWTRIIVMMRHVFTFVWAASSFLHLWANLPPPLSVITLSQHHPLTSPPPYSLAASSSLLLAILLTDWELPHQPEMHGWDPASSSAGRSWSLEVEKKQIKGMQPDRGVTSANSPFNWVISQHLSVGVLQLHSREQTDWCERWNCLNYKMMNEWKWKVESFSSL